jgi:hypothetical protein
MTTAEMPISQYPIGHLQLDSTPVVAEPWHATERTAWDALAQECGASFRCGYRASSGWQLDHHRVFRMQRYALWLQGSDHREQIGQVAIGLGPRVRVFADGLQLRPQHAHRWREAMSAVLSAAGPGIYRYGSRWSLEPRRESECASIAGVRVERVQPITMYAVDFTRWRSWECYASALSENARRNIRKAEKLGDALNIDIRRGSEMLQLGRHLLQLRRGLYARKRIPFSMTTSALRLLLRAWALRDQAFIAVSRLNGEPVCAFGGIVFGDNTFFVDSGSIQEDRGSYWHLMSRMLRDAYERAPHGRFVTGAHYEGSPISPGLEFFRHQCRAEGSPTSEFEFSYEG